MKDFWTSISAYTEAKGKDGKSGCLRRWAFKRFFKLPVPPKEATSFGDVMHAVLQRYYSADDRGLDAAGKPVNLYPDGWKSVPDRFGRDDDNTPKSPLSVLEESLIKVLIAKAISEGKLIRTPGRMVEQPFPNTILYKHPTLLSAMVLKGFIDLETPTAVEDHKTVKRKKDGSTYAVSLKGLQTDAQMLTYAKIKYNKGHAGPLWLIHNNFVKDLQNPEIIRREIVVEKDYVEYYYNTILLPGFMEMFDVYLRLNPKTDVNKWASIKGPADPDSECNHYYGAPCPFSCICLGTTEVCTYIAKFKDLSKQNHEQLTAAESSNLLPSNTINNPISKGNQMNLVDRIKAGNAAVLPSATVPPATPPAVAPPATPPAAPSGGIAGVLAGIKAKAAQVAGAAAAVVVPPVTPPAVSPAVVTPPAPVAQPTSKNTPAPWYQPGCVACTQNDYPGFNSQGNPCQVCENVASLAGKLTSIAYDYGCDEAGNIQFTLKPAYAAAQPAVPTPAGPSSSPVVPPPPPAEKPKRTRRSSTQVNTVPPAIPGQAVSATIPGQAVSATIPGTPTATPPAHIADARTETPTASVIQGEPDVSDTPTARGFDLLIGVAYAKGSPKGVISADDILRESLAYLTSVGGKDVTTLDHFAVKAALEAYIPTVAEALTVAGSTVVAFSPTKGSLLACLLDGLRGYAKTVLVGMA